MDPLYPFSLTTVWRPRPLRLDAKPLDNPELLFPANVLDLYDLYVIGYLLSCIKQGKNLFLSSDRDVRWQRTVRTGIEPRLAHKLYTNSHFDSMRYDIIFENSSQTWYPSVRALIIFLRSEILPHMGRLANRLGSRYLDWSIMMISCICWSYTIVGTIEHCKWQPVPLYNG